MIAAAERVGVSTTIEGFADRVYEPDGRLRPATCRARSTTTRTRPRRRRVSIARDGRARARDGSW